MCVSLPLSPSLSRSRSMYTFMFIYIGFCIDAHIVLSYISLHSSVCACVFLFVVCMQRWSRELTNTVILLEHTPTQVDQCKVSEPHRPCMQPPLPATMEQTLLVARSGHPVHRKHASTQVITKPPGPWRRWHCCETIQWP